MQDQGFNGTGSRFNSRFEAGSPIYAKQLNDLAAGVQAALPQPYCGTGPSVSFTAGGAVIASQFDTSDGSGIVQQFQCVISSETTGSGESAVTKYFLKIAKGNITTVASGFPFTQGINSPGSGTEQPDQPPYYVTPSEQVCIFDAAISPLESRTSGSDINSIWFAAGGKFELDPEVGHYYVTASFFDYNDLLDWYADEALIHTHEPWVSIVPNSGSSYNSIFARNTPHIVTDYLRTGNAALGWAPGTDGIMPTSIGYSMKVIARINWDAEKEVWKIAQELIGPITLDYPVICNTLFQDGGPAAPGVVYGTFLTDKFIGTIYNFNYLAKFADSSFDDSDILDPAVVEWWYDVKTI